MLNIAFLKSPSMVLNPGFKKKDVEKKANFETS